MLAQPIQSTTQTASASVDLDAFSLQQAAAQAAA